ncbi:MAG: hypothetical protein MUE82_12740 [Chloroflexi bacterium]|nr:hypothetical protein [Chloroflexota bacterium]
MNAQVDVRYPSHINQSAMNHTQRERAAEAAEGRSTMRETRGIQRPVFFDHTVHGGASYDFVTTVLGDRLEEAARARVGRSAGAGPSGRTRLGRAVISLGTALGGRATVPAAADALSAASDTLSPAGRSPARTGSAAGGC